MQIKKDAIKKTKSSFGGKHVDSLYNIKSKYNLKNIYIHDI